MSRGMAAAERQNILQKWLTRGAPQDVLSFSDVSSLLLGVPTNGVQEVPEMTIAGKVVSIRREDNDESVVIEIGENSRKQEESFYWKNSGRSMLRMDVRIEKDRQAVALGDITFESLTNAKGILDKVVKVVGSHVSITNEGYPTVLCHVVMIDVPLLDKSETEPVSYSQYAPVLVPQLELSPSYVQPSGLVDAAGKQLCMAYLHNNKCRFRKNCCWSHDVPENILSLFVAKKRAEQKRQSMASDVKKHELETEPPRPMPSFLHEHRKEAIFSYDEAKYPIGEALAALLEVQGGREALSEMHLVKSLPMEPPLCPKVMHAYRFAGKKMPKLWQKGLMREKKLIAAMEKSDIYQHFMDVYRSFVEEVIMPLCGDPKGICCQYPPTIRVHMPSRKPTIPPHTDSDYEGHESGEINFWVPVTKTFGNNTLWVESAPGQKDFRAIEVDYGEILRFNGNQCTHYTQTNDTCATRVSFDFRAIPLSIYRNDHGGKIGDYQSLIFGPDAVAAKDQLPGGLAASSACF